MLLYLVTQQKGAPTAEQQAKAKLSALSAINKASLDLRQAGSLPPEQTITSEGVEVKVSSQKSADGNSIQIVAKAGDEVMTARAVRTVDPAAVESPTPAITPVAGSKLVPDPAVARYLSGSYMLSRDTATGELRVPISPGKYIVVVMQGGKYVAAETQPCFPPVPAGPGEVAPSAAPSSEAPATKWVVYNSDNVILSADSATRSPAAPGTTETAVSTQAEGSKIVPAPTSRLDKAP